jgi:hypothetical protein
VDRWTEALLLALLVAGGGPPAPGAAGRQAAPVAQTAGAGPSMAEPAPPRAVLLEDAELYEDPSSAGTIVARLPAGTVLDYAGETTDVYGRTWYAVRDPHRSERRRDAYLAPFTYEQLRAFGYRAAVLADRRPSAVAAVGAAAAASGAAGGMPAATATPDAPWWRPAGVLELADAPTYGEVVAVSARAAEVGTVRRAIELLGGREAIARWPSEPLPGELFVPAMLPALFVFDGSEWDLAQPVRLLGDAVSLLGNGGFAVDPAAPPLAGGPALQCWLLMNALDPGGAPAGSVAPAPEPAPLQRGQPVPRGLGPFDPSLAPESMRALLAPAPDTTLVPPRVDPPAVPGGVLLSDDDGRQAVFLRQQLGPELTARLRGQAMVLDVVVRDDPRAGAATFGLYVEVVFADGSPPRDFVGSYTSRAAARRYELAFEVPAGADDIVIRLLPLDRGLAVDQQGSVVFERAALRLAAWDPHPPAASVLLHRVTASSFEGTRLYTRAPVAPSGRSADDLQRVWPGVTRTGWTVETQQTVLAGELRHGMNRAQVRAAWGEPAQETAVSGSSSVEWRWAGDDRYALFENGEVIAFRPPTVAHDAAEPSVCPAAIGPKTGPATLAPR